MCINYMLQKKNEEKKKSVSAVININCIHCRLKKKKENTYI